MQFAIVDISNPAKLTVTGALSDSLLSGPYRIRTRGSFAYLSASSSATVAAIDCRIRPPLGSWAR